MIGPSGQFCGLIRGPRADYFEALSLLGIIKGQTQQLEEAADVLSRAVASKPGNATAHNNNGNILRD